MANWFAYIGGDVMLPGSYMMISAAPNCATGCFMCALKLDDNSSIPSSIPGSVKSAIAEALANKTSIVVSANLEVRVKDCP